MTFLDFFEPFFVFWGSDIMSFILSYLAPCLVVITLVRLIFGGLLDVV